MSDFASLAARAPVHNPQTCTRTPCRRCIPHEPSAPPINPAQHDHQGPTDPPDRTVASMGLPRHGTPTQIARQLRDAARVIEQSGLDAIDLVSKLAARGYPTGGAGGSRSSDRTSAPERLTIVELEHKGHWTDADRRYATDLRTLERLALDVKATTHEIIRHADDIDPTPAGSGECRACARTCRPSEDRPGNRLRSGFCPTCYRAWLRYRDQGGSMIRTDWAAQRRESYSERTPDGHLIKVHTPEPDHDIDLTSEQWAG